MITQLKRASAKPSRTVGVRVPIDVVVALDRFCATRDVKRSAVIVAALRAHVGAPDPAEIPMKESAA